MYFLGFTADLYVRAVEALGNALNRCEIPVVVAMNVVIQAQSSVELSGLQGMLEGGGLEGWPCSSWDEIPNAHKVVGIYSLESKWSAVLALYGREVLLDASRRRERTAQVTDQLDTIGSEMLRDSPDVRLTAIDIAFDHLPDYGTAVLQYLSALGK